jgi:hypothetical protein
MRPPGRLVAATDVLDERSDRALGDHHRTLRYPPVDRRPDDSRDVDVSGFTDHDDASNDDQYDISTGTPHDARHDYHGVDEHRAFLHFGTHAGFPDHAFHEPS